jgi:hypothetical protein
VVYCSSQVTAAEYLGPDAGRRGVEGGGWRLVGGGWSLEKV